MAFCTQCGNQVDEGASFCTNCGARLNPVPQTQPVYTQQEPQQDPVNPQQPVPNYYPQQQMPYQAPAKKKKSKAGLIIGILAAVLVLAIGAGAIMTLLGGNSDDPNLGMYKGVSCTAVGIEVGAENEWLELKSGGRASLHLLNDSYNAKWALEGEKFTLTQHGDEFVGTLKDGVLTVDFAGLVYTFAKDGVTVPAATEAPILQTEPPVETVSYDWWESDWYGWWVIYEGTGEYAEREGDYWDCCARISVEDDNTGYFEMWDEDCDGNTVICQGSVTFEEGYGQYGTMVSAEGGFLSGAVEAYNWYVDSESSAFTGDFKDLICVAGDYEDPDGSGDGFRYLIFLRKWGMDWEDVKGVEDPAAVYDDMMPAYYEDWYLPLIQSGVTSAPDDMGID